MTSSVNFGNKRGGGPNFLESSKLWTMLMAEVSSPSITVPCTHHYFSFYAWSAVLVTTSLLSSVRAICCTWDSWYVFVLDLAIGKVEQTPYGERVMLLPEPTMDRGGITPFQKGKCYTEDHMRVLNM